MTSSSFYTSIPYASFEADTYGCLSYSEEIRPANLGGGVMANSDHVLPLFDDDVFTQAGCNDGVNYAGTPQEYMTSPSYSYPVDMTGAWSPGSFGFSDSDESLNNSPSVGYCLSPGAAECESDNISGYYDAAQGSPIAYLNSDEGKRVEQSRPALDEMTTFEADKHAPANLCNYHDAAQGSPLGSLEYPGSDVDADGESDIDFEAEFNRLFISRDDTMHMGGIQHVLPVAKHTRTRSSCTRSSRTKSKAGSPYKSTSSSSRSRKLVSPYKSTSSSSKSRKLVSPRRRVEQVTLPYSELPSYARNDMRCPLCNRKVAGKRPCDLKRHYDCHFPSSDNDAKYVCNGVALDRAAEYGVANLANGQVFNGEMRVGRFCAMRFSRKDALLRHVRNQNFPCVCDVLPVKEYVGNKPL